MTAPSEPSAEVVNLWTEINDYANYWESPSSLSTRRRLAVVCVERAIDALIAKARREALEEAAKLATLCIGCGGEGQWMEPYGEEGIHRACSWCQGTGYIEDNPVVKAIRALAAKEQA